MSVPRAMTREQYDKYEEAWVVANPGYYAGRLTATYVLKATVDDLLLSLFVPTPDGFKANQKLLAELGLTSEPINWGDLGCVSVELRGEIYEVSIEEADSPKLGLWVERWLGRWGWKAIVKTEW